MVNQPKIMGYVLAGGASSRFGTDKALAQLNGKSILDRTCELVRTVTSDSRIVGDPAKYSSPPCITVPDLWPGEGPLGGIITALEDARKANARPTHCLIISCDMPFLTAGWLAYLCSHAASSRADIVVPKSERTLEPLCACWRVTAADSLRQLFESGVRKVTEVFRHVDTEILDDSHWKRFDNAGRLFWNMNTPQDYENALKVLVAEQRA